MCEKMILTQMRKNFKEIEHPVPESASFFRYIETEGEGARIVFGNVSGRYVLSFVLNGEMTLENKHSGLTEVICGRNFFLIPDDERWEGYLLPETELILFFFEKIDCLRFRLDVKSLQNRVMADSGKLPVILPFCSPVSLFMELIVYYLCNGTDDRNLYVSKDWELLELLTCFYSPEDRVALFYPLLCFENSCTG